MIYQIFYKNQLCIFQGSPMWFLQPVSRICYRLEVSFSNVHPPPANMEAVNHLRQFRDKKKYQILIFLINIVKKSLVS